MLVRAAVPMRDGQQRLDQRPLLIGQIRGVKTGLVSCLTHTHLAKQRHDHLSNTH
jgi:hypothetical protein